MKKFINDNIVWFVLGAVILGGLALYKVAKKNEEEKSVKESTEETSGSQE